MGESMKWFLVPENPAKRAGKANKKVDAAGGSTGDGLRVFRRPALNTLGLEKLRTR